MTAAECVTLLWIVSSHWPSFVVQAGDRQVFQVGAWLDIVSDLELGHCRAAAASLAASGREFAPTAGQIRVEVLRCRGDGPPDPDQALAEVMERAHRVGRLGQPGWSHPAVGDAVAAVGGWSAVCTSENLDALRGQFRRAYESSLARHERVLHAPPAVAALGVAVPAALGIAVAATLDAELTADRELGSG